MHFITSFILLLCLVIRTTTLSGCGHLTPVDLCCEGRHRFPCWLNTAGKCDEGEEHVCCAEYIIRQRVGSGCQPYPGLPKPMPKPAEEPLGVCRTENLKCDKSEGQPSEPASTSPKAAVEIEADQTIELATQPTVDLGDTIVEAVSNKDPAWEPESNDFAFLPLNLPARRRQ